MFISINPQSPQPLHQQIHNEIARLIANHRLQAGNRLDPVRKVARELGINPATVKKAYDLLSAEGLVETHSRSGTVVKEIGPPTAAQREELTKVLQQTTTLARAQGFTTEEITTIIKELA